MGHLTKVLLIMIILAGCNLTPPQLSESIQMGFQGTIYIAGDYARLLEKHEPEPSRTAKKEILAGWLNLQKEIYDFVKIEKAEGETDGME